MRSTTPLDERLTVPCERPQLQGETNRDVWALSIEQAYSLGDCAARMEVIRGLGR